jgi:hypothetical protein
MGKGGCKPSLSGESGPVKNNNQKETSILEKERKEKIQAEPNFIWAYDEEPHRRR